MMVEPTKRKPRRARSRDSSSLSAVRAGTLPGRGRLMSGLPAHERPQVAVERAALALDREEGPGVGHRGVDLQAIAHDARIPAQSGAGAGVEARHLARVKARERAAVAGALVQDGRPRQPRLRALERQHLEQPPLIVQRAAPFQVVVAHVVRVVGPRPPAAAPYTRHSRSFLGHVLRSACGARNHTQEAARLDLAAEIYEDHVRSKPRQQSERTGTRGGCSPTRRLRRNEGVRHDDGLDGGISSGSRRPVPQWRWARGRQRRRRRRA